MATTAVMNVCICLCVLLAALSSSSLSLPSESVVRHTHTHTHTHTHAHTQEGCVSSPSSPVSLFPRLLKSQRAEGEALVSDNPPPPSSLHTRQTRSAPAGPSGHLANFDQLQEDANARNSLSQLLARLVSRKGSPYEIRSSLSSRASGPAPVHRIKDRDYQGWMDFGRRSAEESEYPS
uniref:Gastrin/cholecystokinin peptide hormone domain-containing protein n=1 Tax=Gasterosteus aculeatus aculeatus TaxID=481459 RepID=A0AAQ4QUA7_GASAC